MLSLIIKSNENGCRLKVTCDDLEIDFKTFNRWRSCVEDKRSGPISEPKNKLPKETRDEIIKVATSKDYCDDSPWSIVAKLADKGQYIASESSFYKVLQGTCSV